MLRRSSLIECVSVLHGNRCLQSVEFFFLRFCFYVEVNFWNFVRNDNSNKGTTAQLNETRFGPKKSCPQYISAQSNQVNPSLFKYFAPNQNFKDGDDVWADRFNIIILNYTVRYVTTNYNSLYISVYLYCSIFVSFHTHTIGNNCMCGIVLGESILVSFVSKYNVHIMWLLLKLMVVFFTVLMHV
jgi:hypothetical protein